MWQKVTFIWQLVKTSSMIGPRSSRTLPKGKLAPKKGHGHYLMVCCQTDPLQLSESWWNHYVWEVCLASWWDTTKTAMPEAKIGQQKWPNSSPQQCLIAHCTTNAQKLNKLGYKVLLHPPYSLDLSPTDYYSSGILTTFCRENAFTTSQRQKILSKSSLNPEAQIFMLWE